MITADEAYEIKKAADTKAKEKEAYYLDDYCESMMELLPELIRTASRLRKSTITLDPDTLTHTCYKRDFIDKFVARHGDELRELGYKISRLVGSVGPYDYTLSWDKKEGE